MGRIADHVATMRGCSLQQIVDAIRLMEDGPSEDDLFNGEANALINSKLSEFEILWLDCPNRTAKKAAEKAFNAARKRGVSFETIHNGMMRYVMTKPADRPWMHLSTFINGERWNDQPAAVSKPSKTSELRNDLRNRIGERSEDTGHVRRLAQRDAIG